MADMLLCASHAEAVIVVDASAILEVLLGTLDGARVAERIFLPGETLHRRR